MTPTLLIVQDVIARTHDVAAAAAPLGWEPRRFTIPTAAYLAPALDALEAEAVARDARTVVFCGLRPRAPFDAAAHDSAGGCSSTRITRWSATAAHLPAAWLVNPRGVLLPWAHVAEATDSLLAQFGRQLFLRPDSSMKPFTGFTVATGTLAEEVRLHGMTDGILPEEITLVAPARALDGTEFRFWLIDGRVSDGAPRGAAYGWSQERDDVRLDATAPDAAVKLADEIAARLEIHDTLLVADIATIEGQPALVELNGFSTSGFYPGLDFARLLADLEPMLV